MKYFEYEIFEDKQITDEAIGGYEFVDCKFINCAFEKCVIRNCRFSECEFTKCKITDIKNDNSEITFLSFDKCRISGINWGLFASANRFKEPIQKISESSLKHNIFSQMNFSKFKFSGSAIIFSAFTECKLTDSSFKGCDLSETEFLKCDIQKADYRNATGYKIDITSCNMKGAKFSYPEVENLLSSLDIKIEY